MNPTAKLIRITRDLPLDPAHGCLKGTIWEVIPPQQAGQGMKTWIMGAAGRQVALLRHEWEEADALALGPCPHCLKQAQIMPAVKRGLFLAECSSRQDCPVWPQTELFPSEEEAAQAWRAGALAEDSPAAIAASE